MSDIISTVKSETEVAFKEGDQIIVNDNWTHDTPTKGGPYWYVSGGYNLRFFQVSIEISGLAVTYCNGSLINCQDLVGKWMPAKVPPLPKE